MIVPLQFDADSPAVIDPGNGREAIPDFPVFALSCFTQKHADWLLAHTEAERVGSLIAGADVPVWRVRRRGQTFAFYRSPVGGPGAAAIMEEVAALGAKRFLFYGSCGSLDSALTAGHMIVPTAAFRDEGTSRHYLPESDWIDVQTAEKTACVFDAMGVPYVRGKTWTTDAFYRETRGRMEALQALGCVAVEMECASVMAVARHRGLEAYQFLYAADCLDGADWDRRILGAMPDDLRETIGTVALEAARRLAQGAPDGAMNTED